MLGGAPALAIVALAAWIVLSAPPDPAIASVDALAVTARWLVVPALTMWAGLQYVAIWRLTHREDNDGSPETPSANLDIALRYNRNTLEQAVLAGFAWLALAASWPDRTGTAVPLLATLFAVGRVTFWIGYRITPAARAFGFVLTHVPTVLVIVAVTLRLAGLI